MMPVGFGSPLEQFQAGRQLAGPNSLGVFVKDLLDRARKMEAIQAQSAAQAQLPTQQLAATQSRLLSQFLRPDGESGEGAGVDVVPSATGAPIPAVSASRGSSALSTANPLLDTTTTISQGQFGQPKVSKTIKPMSGLSGESAGRGIATSVSVKRVAEARDILFPDGTPNSFDQMRAVKAKIGGLAMIGDTKAQDVRNSLLEAIDSRLLIMSGVAVRPEERQNAINIFFPGAVSTPESAFNMINRLEEFFKTGKVLLDPTGRFATLVDANGEQIGKVGVKRLIPEGAEFID